jgi:murein DD-endopeptidase MepM/ murein hydrolase activator NlpD
LKHCKIVVDGREAHMAQGCSEGTGGFLRPGRLTLLAMLLTVVAFFPAAAPASVAGRGPTPPPPGPDRPRVPALWMPVAGAVVRGFDARAGPYGPGHRGVDIAAREGAIICAPAAGKVVFAGPVAGTTWVSLQVAPGVRVTLGPVLEPVTTGSIPAGAPIGRLGPGHEAAAPGPTGSSGGATLHLGVRVDGVYIDPLAYLVDGPRPRLAPLPTPGGLRGG